MRTRLLNEIFPMNELQTKEDFDRQLTYNKENDWPDLDLQYRAFALDYVTHYDHMKAATNAGFSANSGLSILRKPLVSAFVAHLQSQTFVSNVITEDFIRAQWLNLIPKLAGQEEVPIVTGTGEQVYAEKFYPGELNNLLKEMAKTTKIYDEGSGGSQVNVQINVAALLGGEPDAITRTINPDDIDS